MSISRRIRRAQLREAETHFSVLTDLLMDFYAFLESSPKPSDEEVRKRFINDEQSWKDYCSKKQLKKEASLMFNKEVSQSWEKRYKEQPSESIKN